MKQAALLALFALFSLINANGNAPGNCLLNGTNIPGPGLYAPSCPGGYGRPRGICNCVDALNSCNQLLAGCKPTSVGTVTPAVPSILYVGQYYEFTTNVMGTSPLCFSRPLPKGLTTSIVNNDQLYNAIRISGTPTESVPQAEYGFASGPIGAGSSSIFFSFEVQSCSEDDVPPTSAPTPTPSTLSPSSPSSPSSSPSSSLPTTCSTSEQGFMRCVDTSNYQTCNQGAWGASQSCQTGLVCHKGGDYIYCDRS